MPEAVIVANACSPIGRAGTRIVSTNLSALSPAIMDLRPVDASRQALSRAGLTINDIDLVEINEAFAAQVIPSCQDLGVDIDRLNVHGGAIAVGPLGMTGGRITTTLINGLVSRDRHVRLETMCVGGGQGMAMVLERLSQHVSQRLLARARAHE
jgi:acetyl-CoA C-acetyltransferase